jgi:hypothetical protein
VTLDVDVIPRVTVTLSVNGVTEELYEDVPTEPDTGPTDDGPKTDPVPAKKPVDDKEKE